MERGRPNSENEDHRTVPIFGTSESRSAAPGEEPRTSNATYAQSPAPSPTDPATHRPGVAGAVGPGAILLGKYRVIEKLGEGGMGSVWLVQHMALDERRALKVISEGIAGNSLVRARFDQEARILAKLKHANAVTVHDTGIVGDSAYIEMEYIEGASLRQLLKGGEPNQPAFILWLMRGVCDVLGLAHNRGIVHRDLKPENIMVVTDPETGRRVVKVLDFGIAKIVQNVGDSPVSTMHTEGILGTPHYSSPEQNAVEDEDGRRSPIDHRSDIYSLGVVLYELLTGQRPFKGNWTQVLYQHARVVPELPSRVAPRAQIPPAVEALVMRCLEKTPSLRPASAPELYNELRSAYGDVASEELEAGASTSQARRTPLPLLTPHSQTSLHKEVLDAGQRFRLKALLLGLVPVVACVLLAGAAWLIWGGPAKESDVTPPHASPPVAIAEVSPEVVRYLRSHNLRLAYKPVPGADTIEIDGKHWPTTIVRADDDGRRLVLHERIYLPEGSRPETSAGAVGALRLPHVVINEVLSRPIAFRLIEGGTFLMGDEKPAYEGAAEAPCHKVNLSTYYIQETETTIGEIDDYCARAARAVDDRELAEYRQAKIDLGMPAGECQDHPAVALSRRFCESYARDLGGELPTEAQWEFAARSRGARNRYVWEEDGVRQEYANILNLGFRDINTLGAGSFPKDQTRQGVFDLAGNAREWCRDVWKPYLDRSLVSDPIESPSSGDADPEYVIRGGSYRTPTEMARVTYRSNTVDFGYRAGNDARFDDVGFRVVLEVVIAEPLSAGGSTGPPTKKDSNE